MSNVSARVLISDADADTDANADTDTNADTDADQIRIQILDTRYRHRCWVLDTRY